MIAAPRTYHARDNINPVKTLRANLIYHLFVAIFLCFSL